jgi:hypothetical protein
MANPNQLRMYPRGFLGLATAPQTDRTPSAIRDAIGFMHYRVNENQVKKVSIPPNANVEELYTQYIKRNPITNSLGFRNRVVMTALAAFGTRSFAGWYHSQHQSPACGDMHNRFLTDTLQFIREGRRNMTLETWTSLLVMTDEGDLIGEPSDYSEEFFKYPHNSELLIDVIQSWCSWPNGLEDLLGTLHILFGNP